jgi:hypothetical protein
MKFFNIDLHISVIEDIKTIFNSLGHSVDSWNLSGHNWVFNRSPASVDIVNQQTWKYIDQNMCDSFYERYKHDLSEYDGFIACYPPVFALLYEKFNKPIYIVVATRYEHPFSNDENKWSWLDGKLKSMIDNGQVIPIANNKYDKTYCEYFLDREFKHIPNICSYTESKYNPQFDPIVSGRIKINGLKHISGLGRFNWNDLYGHRAIVHIPYNVSIMSIFEQYTADVPLLFPSPELCMSIKGSMSELFFRPNCRVNSYSTEDILLSDFYDQEWMPFIKQFSSIEELVHLTEDTKVLNEISDNMKKFNEERQSRIHKLWRQIL